MKAGEGGARGEEGYSTRNDDNLALKTLKVLVFDEDFRHLGG